MRSDEAYKAEVFARRDAVLRVRRRRNRVMLSLLPILCVAGLSVALVLRLPQTTPPKESADGTQTSAATRFAGDNGNTNGAVSDDTADGVDGTDTEGYKPMTAAAVLTVTADLSLSPQTVYWADDQKTVIDLAEKAGDAVFRAQATAYGTAFFETHRLLIYYLPQTDITDLSAHVSGDILEIVPQAQADAIGNRLFLLPVDSGVKTVRIADAAKTTRPSVAPDVTDEK